MAFAEVLIHDWDLAAATGRHLEVDEAAASAAYRFIAGTVEMGRQMGAYGAEVSLPPGAATFDRALALAGRDPGWTSGVIRA